jgi:hypothetical protein
MLTVTSVVAGGKIERVRLPFGPQAVELGGVPHNLVHQLRDSDGMRGGTVASKTQEGSWAADGVGDVVLVVGTVEILAIPACREVNVGSNATGAWRRRESLGIDSKSYGKLKHSGKAIIWFSFGGRLTCCPGMEPRCRRRSLVRCSIYSSSASSG